MGAAFSVRLADFFGFGGCKTDLAPHPAKELKVLIKKADTIAAYFEATELAGFTAAEARKFFGQPRGITREMLPLSPLSAVEAQAMFIARFEAIEAERAKALVP